MLSKYDPEKPYGRPYVLHLERSLRPRPYDTVATMISRSSSTSGAPEGDERGYTRNSGRDQYSMYRGGGGGGGGSVGRLGVGGGGTRAATAAAADCSAQRRSFFQQRGQERRLPDAPSDGVIRSASLQHHPSSSMSSSSSMMAVSAAGTATLSSSTSAIGTNHIHNQRQYNSLNRSMSSSSGGCLTALPTSSSKSNLAASNNNNTIRQLKKTVRFDADDEPAATPAATASSSTALPSRTLKANGLMRSESSLLASTADASWKGDNKTWDWLMKGHNTSSADHRHRHHHQDSRESAGRDSGVETLTSGEDVVIVSPRNSSTKYPTYDQHRPKVIKQPQQLPQLKTKTQNKNKHASILSTQPSGTPNRISFRRVCNVGTYTKTQIYPAIYPATRTI